MKNCSSKIKSQPLAHGKNMSKRGQGTRRTQSINRLQETWKMCVHPPMSYMNLENHSDETSIGSKNLAPQNMYDNSKHCFHTTWCKVTPTPWTEAHSFLHRSRITRKYEAEVPSHHVFLHRRGSTGKKGFGKKGFGQRERRRDVETDKSSRTLTAECAKKMSSSLRSRPGERKYALWEKTARAFSKADGRTEKSKSKCLGGGGSFPSLEPFSEDNTWLATWAWHTCWCNLPTEVSALRTHLFMYIHTSRTETGWRSFFCGLQAVKWTVHLAHEPRRTEAGRTCEQCQRELHALGLPNPAHQTTRTSSDAVPRRSLNPPLPGGAHVLSLCIVPHTFRRWVQPSDAHLSPGKDGNTLTEPPLQVIDP